jgi:hypothetical protein
MNLKTSGQFVNQLGHLGIGGRSLTSAEPPEADQEAIMIESLTAGLHAPRVSWSAKSTETAAACVTP